MKFARLSIAVAVAVLSTGIARADDTLWQDMGGVDALKKIASDTADNFLADPRVKGTFDNTNMDRFRILLGEQFCVVAGGPCIYTGRNMKDTHKGLHLKNSDFNATVEDLQKAMDKNGIPFATQNRFLARLAPMQHDIVTKSNWNAATAIFIAAVAALPGAVAVADDANTIVQNGRAFHPVELTVAAGTTLNFDNKDEFIHQIYVDVDGFGYDSAEQSPGQIFHIRFPNAGTFPVRCHIHPKMLLTVHVK